MVQGARAEATRIHDEVTTEVHRLRSECDAYVETARAELEELLTRAMRAIGRGRTPRGKPVPAGIGDYRS